MILEPGDYVIRLGEHSRSTRVAAVLRLESEILWEQLSPRPASGLCDGDGIPGSR